MFRIEIVGSRQHVRGGVSEAIENFLHEMGYRTAHRVTFYRGVNATHFVDWCVDGVEGVNDQHYRTIIEFLEARRLDREVLNWRHYEIPSTTV